ncbi:hypothetical protein ACFWNK_10910 [Streptomyces sp. NPDC058417]|uniref:hypothetical protein n=1 Tax=unclassified Streptomyces TaxID=2593676 RepID=UPI0036550E3F
MPVVFRRDRRGIAYADERSFDRDAHGVLWERTPSQPGRGAAQFGKVHSLRQRLCMTGLRCQICGAPADRTPDGVLWLIDAHPGELLPVGETTAHPPVCRPCAHLSSRACPHLRSQQVALRVRRFRPSGVRGALYLPGPTAPRLFDAQTLPLTDPRLPWLLGSQLLVHLIAYTPIELNDPTA